MPWHLSGRETVAAFTSRNGRLAYLSSQKEISLGVKTNHPNSTEEMTGLGRHLSAKRVEALGIFKTQKVSKTLHNDTVHKNLYFLQREKEFGFLNNTPKNCIWAGNKQPVEGIDRANSRAWRAWMEINVAPWSQLLWAAVGQKERTLMRTLQSDPKQPSKFANNLVLTPSSWKWLTLTFSCGIKSKKKKKIKTFALLWKINIHNINTLPSLPSSSWGLTMVNSSLTSYQNLMSPKNESASSSFGTSLLSMSMSYSPLLLTGQWPPQRVTESHNVWGWKGTLEIISSTLFAQAGSPTAYYPASCPIGFWVPPGRETPQPLMDNHAEV